MRLSVGINAADPLRLGEQLDELACAGIDTLHLDVFDGRYAGPLSGGSAVVGAVAGRFACDVHLMVDNPEDHIDAYVEAGAWAITFHPETTRQPHRLLRHLSTAGVVRGIALSPSLPVAAIEPLLNELDLILVLGIDPGRRDAMSSSTAERVREVIRRCQGSGVLVSVDGGVNTNTAALVGAWGCDLVVAGTAVFAADGAGAGAQRMLEQLRAASRSGTL